MEREDNMKTETLDVIRSILAADETVPKDKIDIVLRTFRQMKTHRHLIGARQAMEILGVSRPTLRAYVKQGGISQIGFSSRKVRFDEEEIRSFADNGIPTPEPIAKTDAKPEAMPSSAS